MHVIISTLVLSCWGVLGWRRDGEGTCWGVLEGWRGCVLRCVGVVEGWRGGGGGNPSHTWICHIQVTRRDERVAATDYLLPVPAAPAFHSARTRRISLPYTEIISDHQLALKSLAPNMKLKLLRCLPESRFKSCVHTPASKLKVPIDITLESAFTAFPYTYMTDGRKTHQPLTPRQVLVWSAIVVCILKQHQINNRWPLNILISCGHFQERDSYRTETRI